MYNYESDWGRYAFAPSPSRIATDEDVRNEFTRVDTGEARFSGAGIPLLMEGEYAYLNNETENYLVFGETGCKKTRCVVRPLIAMCAGAKESAFVIDIKGELSSDPKVMRYLDEKGVKKVVLDFRNFNHDGYNILQHAMELYKAGKQNKAVAGVTNLVSALSSRYNNAKCDPYWQLMGEQHMIPVIHMLMEMAISNPDYEKYVNMLSVASFANEYGTYYLDTFAAEYLSDVNTNTTLMLKGVLATPDRTKSSIVSVTSSMLRDFIVQENLASMLSVSTFSPESMYEESTMVFIVLPDESSAYDSIAGMLIDNFYSQLLEKYAETYQNSHSPGCRINFICDEACNVKINDMKAKISASRSRFMRWFFICQSLSQLEKAYENEASTIIGNCKNIMLLQSSDPKMLKYISDLCGVTAVSLSECGEPLVPVDSLRKLRKTYEYKEAVIIRDDLVYLATLPDIDCYEFLKPYSGDSPYVIEGQKRKPVEAYSPANLMSDIEVGEIDIPFRRNVRNRKRRAKMNKTT